MAKRVRAIVCEGRDDLAAFRAILQNEDAKRIQQNGTDRREIYETETTIVSIESAGSKSKLAERAIGSMSGGAVQRPDAMLISFDPDDDPKSKELTFFERDVTSRKAKLEKDERGERLLVMGGKKITLHMAPWRSDLAPLFAELPEEHCLERVLLDGLLKSFPRPHKWTAWAETSVGELAKLVADKGYKRAFRIWNAVVEPDSESFVAKLLQHDETKAECLRALKESAAYPALELLLG